MIKLVFCVRQRSDLSREEFYRYWLNDHGPLVASFADTLKIQRYVQSHTVSPELGEATSAARGMKVAGFDGLAELWWESAEALESALSSAEGQAANLALLEDEARFIDLENSTIFFTEEHEVVPG
jgi:uncharacterized protein (TIGR02118 family)